MLGEVTNVWHNLTMQKRIAHYSKGSAAINDVIKVLDLATVKFGLPILQEVVDSPSHLGNPQWDAVILDSVLDIPALLKHLDAPLTFMSSFVTAESYHFLLWPQEESYRYLLGKASPAETWFDAAHLSKHSLIASVSQAISVFRDFERQKVATGPGILPHRLGWIHMGWLETEEYALSVLREMEPEQTVVVPFQDIPFAAGKELPRVLVCLPKTALPLARLMDAQSWVAWNSTQGQIIGQASSTEGAVFLVRNLLDRLGFVSEALELERSLMAWKTHLSAPERTVAKFCEIVSRGA